MPSYQVKQSSTAYPLVFLMVDASDHISGKTGLTPGVTISKSGGAFAAPSGAVSEIANGVYKVAGNATDTATLGPLWLHATGTGADVGDYLFEVVAIDPQSAAGFMTGINGGTVTAPSAGNIFADAVKVGGGTTAAASNGNVLADWQRLLGGIIPTPNVTGIPKVDALYVAGTSAAAPSAGGLLTILLSAGTATGQLDFTSGVVKSNDVQLLGTAIPTPATNGVLDINVKKIGNTATVGQPGYVGIDWSHVYSTSAVNQMLNTNIGQATFVSNAVDISAAAAQLIWDYATSSATTAGSIGKLLATMIDAAVSSRLSAAGYTTPPTAAAYRVEMDANSVVLPLLARTTGAVASAGSVTGDIAGKVLGGGSSTITGTGARVVDATGDAIMPASAYTAPDNASSAAAASSAASAATSAGTAATNTATLLVTLPLLARTTGSVATVGTVTNPVQANASTSTSGSAGFIGQITVPLLGTNTAATGTAVFNRLGTPAHSTIAGDIANVSGGGGNTTVIVAPISATITVPRLTTAGGTSFPITLLQNQELDLVVAVVDATGAAVDLTGDTIRVVIYDQADNVLFQLDSPAYITIATNQLTISFTGTQTADKLQAGWLLWDETTKTPIVQGSFVVKSAPIGS